ncbi:unnamed protein product [Anisakis simplex]|uniref:Protein YIF1 n=1 Tax=Anisakis simplex TaxID=6269 RepID=A0A0M3JS69_ANISI|nr:unnamed protein product [Anisakis simplex]
MQYNSRQEGFTNGSLGGLSHEMIASDPMLQAAKQIGGQFAQQQKEREWSVKYDSSDRAVPPRYDVNAPDLYIPVMAFISYILLCGFVLGIQQRFSPEQLVYIRYLRMDINLIAFLVGGKLAYYTALSYTSIAIVFFLLRTVKNFVLDIYNNYGDGRKRKIYLLIFISFTQPFIMWWLTSGVTRAVANDKLELAGLALSGVGVSLKPKAELPLTDDGEVDYEALLKMP